MARRPRLRRLPRDPEERARVRAERAALRNERRARRRRRAMAALPQGITLGSVFFAMLALTWAPTRPYAACVCIFLAGICDMLDGRVARLTGTTSAFGAQLDSLADVVSFGVAPAWIFYHWAFAAGPAATPIAGEGSAPFNPWLILVFAYVACGAIRLARFNTGHDDDADPEWFFEGIAIPTAAGSLLSLVMAHTETGWPILKSPVVIVPILIITSALMVSQIPFPSFKNFRNAAIRYTFFGSILGALVLLAVGGPGGTVMFFLVQAYIVFGLVRSVNDNLRPGVHILDDPPKGPDIDRDLDTLPPLGIAVDEDDEDDEDEE